MNFPITISNLRLLVDHLPDSLAADESTWRDVCASLKNAGGEEAWPIFLDFSSRSVEHGERGDLETQARRMWLRTIKQCGIGTLLHYLPPGSMFLLESKLEPIDPSWVPTPVASTVDALCDRPEPKTSPETLDNFLDFKTATSKDIVALSPLPIQGLYLPGFQASTVIDNLFREEDYVFIGEARDWCPVLKLSALNSNSPNAVAQPYLIVNPMNGIPVDTPDGKPSYRGDNNITDLRLAVVEFDKLPMDKQFAFWLTAINKHWPVVGVVDSGGKSLHGWIYVGCRDLKEWRREVSRKLFMQYLEPMGVDGQCKNPARLTRLPGYYRKEYGRFQTLYYFNPDLLNNKKEEDMTWL